MTLVPFVRLGLNPSHRSPEAIDTGGCSGLRRVLYRASVVARSDPCAAFRLPDGGLHFFSMGVAYIPPACEDYLLDGGK